MNGAAGIRMDDETCAAFDRIDRWFDLGEQQHLELRVSAAHQLRCCTTRQLLARRTMDEETRAAFVRVDRYFERAQAQHLELRDGLRRVEDRLERLVVTPVEAAS